MPLSIEDKKKIRKAVAEMKAIKGMRKVKAKDGILPAVLGILNNCIATPKGVSVRGSGGYKLKGRTTGRAYRCQLEGCTGYRIVVKWEDGHITHPCSKGMKLSRKGWRIL